MTKKLQITDIRIDGGTQARAGLNSNALAEYVLLLQDSYNDDGSVMWPFRDPVDVYYDGNIYWLADGFHRVAACKQHGRYVVQAEVHQGTRRDAILHAAGANAAHGVRRTNDDKRRAVRRLLEDDEWGQWSDREIARRCKVSPTFVGSVRRELTVHVDSEPQKRKFTDRYGNEARMKTANIGQSKPVMATVPEIEAGVRDWINERGDNIDPNQALLSVREIMENSPHYQSLVRFLPGTRSRDDTKQAISNVLTKKTTVATPSIPDEIEEMPEAVNTAISWLRDYTDEHDRTWQDITKSQAIGEFKRAYPDQKGHASLIIDAMAELRREANTWLAADIKRALDAVHLLTARAAGPELARTLASAALKLDAAWKMLEV